MGQRHQIFLKMINPLNHFENLTPNQRKKLETEFGKGEFSILSFHNQWLYGRSALDTALRMLEFAKEFTKEEKTDKNAWGNYHCPISPKGISYNFSTKDKLISAIQFILNFRAKGNSAKEAGFDNSWYLGTIEPEMNFDYSIGDNNDGITIIDLVENKYCFMNINTPYNDELGYSASDLPQFKPVDAKKYVSAYYGETIETTNPYYFGDHDKSKVKMSKEKQQKIVNANIKKNRTFSRGFDKFEVLTEAEIKAMFPKMKARKVVI